MSFEGGGCLFVYGLHLVIARWMMQGFSMYRKSQVCGCK